MVKILPTYPGIKLQGSMFAMYSGNKYTNKIFNTCSQPPSNFYLSNFEENIVVLLSPNFRLCPSAEIEKLVF